MPAELPVMAALTESGLKNLNFGDVDSIGFFQMRLGIWNQGEYAGFAERPDLQLKWFIDQAKHVHEAMRRRNRDPLGRPETYGEWAADVTRPPEQYRGRFQPKLPEAQRLLGLPVDERIQEAGRAGADCRRDPGSRTRSGGGRAGARRTGGGRSRRHTGSVTPWIAFAGGVIAAALSAFITLRQVRLKSELDLNAQRAQTLATYREPLAAAAFDLQSRLYNILRLDFFDRWEAAEPTTRSARRCFGSPSTSAGRRSCAGTSSSLRFPRTTRRAGRRDPGPDQPELRDPRAGHGDDDLE